MSQYYNIDIRIDNETLTNREREKIREVLYFKKGDVGGDEGQEFYLCCDKNISGGEDTYSEEAAKEIWETLGRFVDIKIYMTYLEDPPSNYYGFDKEKYDELV